jgi:nucleobase:cation symporter-1, NCS1 family
MTDQGHPMPQAIGTDQKLFSFWDNTAIWFSLGVGLLVVQLGSFMVGGIGTKYAFVAIIVGSLIGAAILAYGAKIGQVTGQSSASLMTATFGNGFAKLPIILNIVQLLGWTAFELVIMSDGSIAIAEKALGHSLDGLIARLVCAACWGGILCLLLSQKMQSLARGISAKILMPLVVTSLVWLSYQFISKLDATGPFSKCAGRWQNVVVVGDGSRDRHADFVVAVGGRLCALWQKCTRDPVRHLAWLRHRQYLVL